ncbi:MAG: hypothetical protein KVP17_002971 [Porospora cf. gigantea B]|uniref:uncharacterized protein n=1 Tax=Porospora cf. gigantea B TaxID=2853592 RepID=UPI003571AB41|nr:MAG: hypothetical protein KVP17_002971 [Porospora cf. gigantea B]
MKLILTIPLIISNALTLVEWLETAQLPCAPLLRTHKAVFETLLSDVHNPTIIIPAQRGWDNEALSQTATFAENLAHSAFKAVGGLDQAFRQGAVVQTAAGEPYTLQEKDLLCSVKEDAPICHKLLSRLPIEDAEVYLVDRPLPVPPQETDSLAGLIKRLRA